MTQDVLKIKSELSMCPQIKTIKSSEDILEAARFLSQSISDAELANG